MVVARLWTKLIQRIVRMGFSGRGERAKPESRNGHGSAPFETTDGHGTHRVHSNV